MILFNLYTQFLSMQDDLISAQSSKSEGGGNDYGQYNLDF